MQGEEERSYGTFTLLFVPETEAEEGASGLYVKLHDIIAILRFEALMTDSGESLDECLDSIADAFAEQAILAMDELGDMGW